MQFRTSLAFKEVKMETSNWTIATGQEPGSRKVY